MAVGVLSQFCVVICNVLSSDHLMFVRNWLFYWMFSSCGEYLLYCCVVL